MVHPWATTQLFRSPKGVEPFVGGDRPAPQSTWPSQPACSFWGRASVLASQSKSALPRWARDDSPRIGRSGTGSGNGIHAHPAGKRSRVPRKEDGSRRVDACNCRENRPAPGPFAQLRWGGNWHDLPLPVCGDAWPTSRGVKCRRCAGSPVREHTKSLCRPPGEEWAPPRWAEPECACRRGGRQRHDQLCLPGSMQQRLDVMPSPVSPAGPGY